MTDTTTEDPGLSFEYVNSMYLVAALGGDFDDAMLRGVPDSTEMRQRFAELEREVADITSRGHTLWGFDD